MYEWIENLDKKKFYTPICVKNDCDYYDKLKEVFFEIREIIKQNGTNELYLRISSIQDKILDSIQYSYNGDTSLAQNCINEVVDELLKSDYIVANVNEHYALKNFEKHNLSDDSEFLKNKKVEFYRARISKEHTSFSPIEMYHIPFNKRGIIDTQRFSIPGLPCIYLGSSSYVCWAELDKPIDNEFCVSRVELDDDIKLFNLATNIQKIFVYTRTEKEDLKNYSIDLENLIDDYLALWQLTIATSFKVNEENRKFKSEYIIPQLIMLSLKNKDIDGVAYYSKKLTEDYSVVGYMQPNINVAIFADYKSIIHDFDNAPITNKKYSDICKKIKISPAVNYADYKNSKWIDTQGNYGYDDFNDIKLGSVTTSYLHTEFYRFEKYLRKFFKDNMYSVYEKCLKEMFKD